MSVGVKICTYRRDVNEMDELEVREGEVGRHQWVWEGVPMSRLSWDFSARQAPDNSQRSFELSKTGRVTKVISSFPFWEYRHRLLSENRTGLEGYEHPSWPKLPSSLYLP